MLGDILAQALRLFDKLSAEALRDLGHDVASDQHDEAIHELPAITVTPSGLIEGLDCTVMQTMKRSHLAAAAEGKTRGLVWHCTNTNGVLGSALKLAARLQDPKNTRQASWHILLGRDGLVVQSVPLTMGAWHAGSDTAIKFELVKVNGYLRWRLSDKGKLGANSLFCGIEIENVGEVRKCSGNVWRGWPYDKIVDGSKGPIVKPEQVVEYTDPKTKKVTYWQNFTQAQEDAAERVVRAVVVWAGLPREHCAFTHQEIDPTRRTDPGPIWSKQVLPRVLGRVFS